MLEVLLVAAIVVAVGFDFTNGFHDTANAIATSVSTRALTPRQAVLLSAVLNLVGALVTVIFFQARVSNTIAKILATKPAGEIGLVIVIAALLGAIAWNLFTWYLGLPSSSTHALIGGLVGAGIASAGGWAGVHWAQLGTIFIGLVTSPPAGFLAATIFTSLLLLVVRHMRPHGLNRIFRVLQIPAAAFVSYSHGSNDAQKTMATITLALVATGNLHKFQVPIWVVLLSATAIAFGTYAGGWRIIRTLGWRIYRMDPAAGMAAQLMGATVIQVATQLGLPVSTTHVVTGSVIGSGAPRRISARGWGVGANILLAWVVTIPAAGAMSWVAYAIMHTAGLG